ncbi:MAG: CDP-glucose 4,6-dehydratase [Desulfobacula sp.]|nr:CDP-glucose 4,6-dehydratase [Desulfobacula sp.]
MEGVEMIPDFWKGKRVFLTGHTGFKGSWMSLWLQNMGAKVMGYALSPPSNPNLFEVGHIADSMISLKGDIRNLEKMQRSLARHQSEIVIHMAAQSLVRYSYQNPVGTYSTNIMGTVNVLEAVRHTPCVKAVLIITSDKCYENREWDWSYRENDEIGGRDPYSNSKGCAELVTAAYRQSFFNETRGVSTAIASVRAGNVIGGGDWAADRLIPDIMAAITKKSAVLIRNPGAIRPWQFVLEPLSGYLTLAQKLYEQGVEYAEGWNFGPKEDDAKTVQWIVEQITEQWGKDASWVLDKTKQPHEAHYLKLDCSKAKKYLNWNPGVSLTQALENIVSWHKAYLLGKNMREFSLKQIADFQGQISI